MSHPPRGAGVSARTNQFSLHLLSVSAIALACAIPQSAAAQQLTEAQTTILERFVLTATRQAKNVLDVPASVTVIDKETLEKHQVRDIQDLVRYEPGVQVDRSSSLTQPWAQLGGFTIRGVSGNRVQMQVDGSRTLESIIDGGRDVIDPWNMKQVEIVKGPAGVLWGADALGGVVAFETLDPEDLLEDSDKPWAVEVKTAFDSFDQSFRKQINAAYDFGDFAVMGSFGNTTGHEPTLSNARADGGIWGCNRAPQWDCDAFFPTDNNAYNGMLKGVWTPNEDHRLELTAEIYDRQTDVDQKYDSSTNAVMGTPANNSQYNVTDWTRTVNVERYRLAVEHEWQVGADWLDSLKWKASYSPQSRGTDSFKRQDYLTRYTTSHQVRDYGETFLEGEVQAMSSFELGETSHRLTYGFDGDISNTRYDDYNENFNSAGTPQWIYSSYNGFSFPDVETVRADLYVQDEIKLLDDKLTITPGLRLATYSIDPTKGYAPEYLDGYEPEKIESVKLIKAISGRYQLDDSWSVYAAYNEGFKMPTSQQLFVSSLDPFSGGEVIPNPDLRPESVQSYELGVRGEFEKGWLSATVFHADYTDFIQRLQEVGPDTYTSLNLSRVKLSGIELASEFEVYENLFFNTALTYQYGRQQATEDAEELFYEPATPLTAVLGLRYELPDNGLEFEVFGTFAAGPTDRNDPNAFKPDGYAIFDAFAKWEPAENIELTAGVQNIFDTRYFPNTLNGYNLPGFSGGLNTGNSPPELQTGPGRTFKLGASVKF